MADIRIKDLATTASTTALDDFMAVDGTTNGTRKLSAATPSFATSVTVPSVVGPTSTDLTLTGGSTGASLVLGQGTTASTLTSTAINQWLLLNNTAASNGYVFRTTRQGATLGVYHTASAVSLGTVSNHPLDFFTFDGSTQARLTTTGNLLIGTTTDIAGTGGLHVAGTGTASTTTSGALRVGSNIGLSGNAGGASYFGGNVLISSPSSSAFPTFQSQNDNGGNAIISVGTSGSARGGTYFGLSEANLSLIFANGTSSAGLGIGTFNAKPLVLGTNNTAALTFNATTQAATFAGAVTGKLITTQADDTSSGFVVKRSVNPYIDFYDGGTSGTIRAEISATNDGVSGGTLVLAPRNAAGTITTALTLTKDLAATFAGAVTVSGTGTSTISSATTGAAGLMLRNTAAGTGNYGILGIGNDSDANAFNIITFSSTYSGSGANTANFSRIENNRASAGLNLVAGGAGGTVNIYAGGEGAGSKVATFSSTLDATFAGTVIAPAATTALAPMRIPHGTAPTSPVNGDMWTTTAGLFVRINGVTVGPLS